MNPSQLAKSLKSRTTKAAYSPSVTITRPGIATPAYAIGDVIGTNGGVTAATVTITSATPGLVTWGSAHGLMTGDAVTFKTAGGTIAAGLTDDTVYYVVIPEANPTTTFNLSDTKAHALAGTNLVATSDAGTGTTTCAKLGSAVLEFAAGQGGEMTVIKQALFFNDASSLQTNLTGFRLHLYDQSPPSALLDNEAWTLPAGDKPGYLGYVDIGTPVDVGPSLAVQTAVLDKYFTTPTGILYGYLAIAATNTVTFAAGSVSTVKLFAVSA